MDRSITLASLMLISGLSLAVISSNQIYKNFLQPPLSKIEELAISEPTKPEEIIHPMDRGRKAEVVADENVKIVTKKLEKQVEKRPEIMPQKPVEKCTPSFTILFEKNTKFSKSALPEIEKMVTWLKSTSHKNVVVEGHADRKGSEIFNLKLSHRRAKKVASVLEKRGLSPDRITTQAFGEYQPVAGKNKKQELRRAVIKVVGQTPCKEKE